MIDDVFAVIADPTRRQILDLLASGKRPVGELVTELGVSQPTVSKHLKVLRNVNLVETEAAGQKRFYSLTPQPLSHIADWVQNLLEDGADSAQAEKAEVSQPMVAQTVEETEEVAEAESVEVVEQAEETAEVAESSEPDESADADETSEPAETADVDETAVSESESETDEDEELTSSAVSFTPLAPFTPTLLEPAQEEEVAEEEAESAAEESAEEMPADAEEETQQSPAGYEYVQEVTGTAVAGLAEDISLQPGSAYGDDQESRGLLAALTRWGRRRR